MTNLPSPNQLLGMPHSKFADWYPGQDGVFKQLMDWLADTDPEARFFCLSIPTGSGKSLSAMLAAKLSGIRTCILTATKGLQEQILSDFRSVGIRNVKGQNNFICSLVPNICCDEGPCHDGISCAVRTTCPYQIQLAQALQSRLVLTNYAYYLAQNRFSSGIGDFKLLIADEANMAFGALESHLVIHLSRMDIESMGLSFPRSNSTWEEWRVWADVVGPAADRLVEEVEAEMKATRTGTGVPKNLRVFRSVALRINGISSAIGDWVVQHTRHGFLFRPIWVADYSHLLYRDVPKILLMSALLSPKSADSIGVPQERRWWDMGSSFPAANTPIWHVPTVRINYQTSALGINQWLSRIDQIISRRLDRKGIVFTVSYDRRNILTQRSRYADIMLSHSTSDVVAMVQRFKAMKPPAVFVSPSITSGWDFLEDECRYIIVGKIPYPDTKDLVTMARAESDKEWTSFMAMETLVNEAGRGSRSQFDKCEVLIVDDNWKWFYKRYQSYAPKYFQERVRGSLQHVPDPLI